MWRGDGFKDEKGKERQKERRGRLKGEGRRREGKGIQGQRVKGCCSPCYLTAVSPRRCHAVKAPGPCMPFLSPNLSLIKRY